MKEKKIVTYTKNGKKVTKEFNIFTKNAIIKDLFILPYPQPENYELEQIKQDTDYVELKNMNFKKEVRFNIPEHTQLVLENCDFNGKINITGGNVTILNCNFNPCNYTNRLFLNDVNELKLKLNNDKSYLTITGKSKNTEISGKYRIETMSITGEKAIIENMHDIKNLKLINNETILKDCDFAININNDTQLIQTKNLKINNSHLFYQIDFENIIISQYEEKQNKRTILIDRNTPFQIVNLELKNNSIIETNNNIIIKNQNITIDNSSKIKSQF